MNEHTPFPWKWHSRIEDLDDTGPLQTGSIYSDNTIGHVYAVAIAPKYQTEWQWKTDAAFIVKACEAHHELVEALERAREGINALVLSTHSVSFTADLKAIDAVLERTKS